MNYDFDTIINRYGTDSIKYDFSGEKGYPPDTLPMWVADMDFSMPPEVLEDINRVTAHGIFGYTKPGDDYYSAVINWFASRFAYSAAKEEIIDSPGVIFSLVQVVKALSNVGDAVLVQTPVYNPFFNVVRENNRSLVTNPLIYSNGKYTIDFADFEQKIAVNDVKLFILCSPHNPVGRVWTAEELNKLNDICLKYGVKVVSDEIHCDFVWPGNKHTCFGLVNENAVIAVSPSKTFNMAGLQVSSIFVKNTLYRDKIRAEFRQSGYGQLNTLGLAAGKSAYTKGASWFEALKIYLYENIKLTGEFIKTHIPEIKFTSTEASYLMWLDFSHYGLKQKELDRRILEGAKLWLSSGTGFGLEGRGFQRINLACPRKLLLEVLERLRKEFAV